MAQSPKNLWNIRYEAIKPYVTIKRGKGGKWTNHQKREIREYHGLLYGKRISRIDQRTGERVYEGIQGLLARPVYHYKQRVRKAKRRVLQQYSATPGGYTKLKGFLIPVAQEGDKPKLTFSKGKDKRLILSIEEDHVSKKFYAFSDYETGELIVTDSAGELVERIIQKTRKNRKGKEARFKIRCGKASSGDSFSEDTIAQEVQRYFNEYDNAEEWCLGIEEYTYKTSDDIKAYSKKERANRKAKQKALKTVRKKDRQTAKGRADAQTRKKRESNRNG